MENVGQIIVTGTIGFLSLAGGIVAVWWKANEKIIKAETQVTTLEERVDRLEKRINDFENKIFEKLDNIHDIITEVKISIAKR